MNIKKKFKKDKQYVFSYNAFLDSTLYKEASKAKWPKLAHGVDVQVISEDTGIVYVNLVPGAPEKFDIVADWCEEKQSFYETIEFKFVKHEEYRGKLNKLLDYLESRGYEIKTEIYLKNKTKIRAYSLLENKHVKIKSTGINEYKIDYYREILEG